MLIYQSQAAKENRFSYSTPRYWALAFMTTATLFASVGLLFPTSAMAADKGASMAVGYADLDLARPADVNKLKHRVTRAARALCVTGGVASMVHARKEKRCVTNAVSRALGETLAVSDVQVASNAS